MRSKIVFFSLMILTLAVGTAGAQNLPAIQQQPLLPGAMIQKFVEPLPVAGDITVVNATSGGAAYTASAGAAYPIVAREFLAQIVPPGTCPTSPNNSASWVWGYRTEDDWSNPLDVRESYLGPVVIAERGVPFYPKYGNALPPTGESMVLANLPIDMTLDWANPEDIDCDSVFNAATGLYEWQNLACGDLPPYNGPVPIATHLHGGEVPPAFDGGPDAWFTQNFEAAFNTLTGSPITPVTGSGFPGYIYSYLNDQQESTIWFHDHALGITRLNVYAGLAGLYPIIDPAGGPIPEMPAFPAYDIPLIIQDRSFDTSCEIFYNLASNPQPNPTVHPFWIPEFIGDTIVVNGKTWPYLDVEPRQYRFRFVNGSNARFYDLTVSKGVKIIVVATDDGYLPSAVQTPNLILGPGERYEVIMDFSGVKPGKSVIMMNAARTPFPGGAAPIAGLTDQVMQFRVVLTKSAIPDTNIANGTPIRSTPLETIVDGHDPLAGSITRQLTLNEVIGPGGPLELVVNNSKFNLIGNGDAPTVIPGTRETELPALGDTEIWEIINITADAHPMHTHLVAFQVLERIPFLATPWINQYDALLVGNGILPGHGPPNNYLVPNADGAIGGNPAIGPFMLMNKAAPPLPYEMGWKDTVITYPGEVTRIAIRWAVTDVPVGGVAVGENTYPFNPTILEGGVGYVWHCHIIDHEDNEMMRNYLVGTGRQL